MRQKTLLALGLLAVAGVAAAGAITVTQRTDLVSLFAERVTLRDGFTMTNSTILPSVLDLNPNGLEAFPLEMATPFGEARTSIVRDHWVYALTVQEKSTHEVTSGTFALRLMVDGTAVGAVYVKQASSDFNQVEGVRASFDVGASLSPDALYYLDVRPFTPPGTTVAVTLRADPTGTLRWLGEGDAENPAISLPSGAALALTILGTTDATHNIGVKNAAGALQTPPGWSDDIEADGATVTIAWTPSGAGSYTYVCKYHSTMAGTITVA